MRFVIAITIAAALWILVDGTSMARAAGYDRQPAQQSQTDPCGRFPRTQQGLYDAVKRAAFVDKYPGWIDEVTSTVKDILGQFGLTHGADR